VAGGGDVDSMFWFRLERGDDGTKRCRKMKRRQRACLGSMERKRDTARWRGDVDGGEVAPGREKGGDDVS
jgi:hypothetical protein